MDNMASLLRYKYNCGRSQLGTVECWVMYYESRLHPEFTLGSVDLFSFETPTVATVDKYTSGSHQAEE